jgi:Fe-Mn family superoxide dismutase
MPYEVPPLPYDYDALEPHVDEATMRVHHDKHHQAYVDKVNAALEGTEWADRPIEDVIANLSQIPDDKRTAVRNNGGGHYNHSLFWEWMSRDGGGEPDGELASAIESAFGSFGDFQAKFKDAGVNQFGSCTTARASPSSRRPTRTTRSPTARRRCSGSTSGSTPTT